MEATTSSVFLKRWSSKEKKKKSSKMSYLNFSTREQYSLTYTLVFIPYDHLFSLDSLKHAWKQYGLKD